MPSKKAKSIFYKPEYSSGNGTAQLKDIMHTKVFNNPKPIDLIIDIIKIATKKSNAVVLDFMAGSGTTLNAIMKLNSQKNMTITGILITNNESNICQEITYERNKRIIQGYTNFKGVAVEGLTNNNLRYYKCEFVPSSKNEKNKRLLTAASTELLCIKEDCYTDITKANGFNDKECKLFTNDCGKYIVVVYHSRNQLAVCDQLTAFINTIDTNTEKVRLYAFSPERETLVEDFIEIADKIEAVPLPEAIYNAYRATFRILKLDKKPTNKTTVAPYSATNTLFDKIEAEA